MQKKFLYWNMEPKRKKTRTVPVVQFLINPFIEMNSYYKYQHSWKILFSEFWSKTLDKGSRGTLSEV